MTSLRSQYQVSQNARVSSETTRSMYQSMPQSMPPQSMMPQMMQQMVDSGLEMLGFGAAQPQQLQAQQFQQSIPGIPVQMPMHDIMPVPDAKDCIGQIVLDWEFIHDLDLHILKLDTSGGGGGSTRSMAEPSPEPNPTPLASPSASLDQLVSSAGELVLPPGTVLKDFVSYSRKGVRSAEGASTPFQAVLQLDRNAAVHSHKPVENCYLTNALEPGVYAVKVHSYSHRQLRPDLFPQTYRTWEDFTKRDPGYLQMENALQSQADHAGDEESPEKLQLMAQADMDIQTGFGKIVPLCYSGDGRHGVHYGVTIYTYPRVAEGADAKHPQAATVDELENGVFPSEFFATSESILEVNTAGTSGYNGGSNLADITTEDGRKALCEKDYSIVALLKVVREDGGRSRLAEVKVLKGTPQRARLGAPFGAVPRVTRHQAVLHRGAGGALQRVVQVSGRGARASAEPQPEPELSAAARPQGYPSYPSNASYSQPQLQPQPQPQPQPLQRSQPLPRPQLRRVLSPEQPGQPGPQPQLRRLVSPEQPAPQQPLIRVISAGVATAPQALVPGAPVVVRQVAPVPGPPVPQGQPLSRHVSPASELQQSSLEALTASTSRPAVRTGQPVVASSRRAWQPQSEPQ